MLVYTRLVLSEGGTVSLGRAIVAILGKFDLEQRILPLDGRGVGALSIISHTHSSCASEGVNRVEH